MISTVAPRIESVKAYSHYLVMKSQLIGLTTTDSHKPTAEERELQSEIRNACVRMTKELPYCTANDIASLTGFYSLLYTIGYRRMPETSLLEKQRDRLLRLWTAGDKTIAESDIYGMLSDLMKNPTNSFSPITRQAFNRLRESWVTTLKRHNSFPETTTYERYRRLALIMRDNVDFYYGGDCSAAKEKWYDNNRITEFNGVSTKILTAYRQFICSLFPAVLGSAEMKKLEVSVLKEIVTRKDLDAYDRKAYQLALAFETRRKQFV